MAVARNKIQFKIFWMIKVNIMMKYSLKGINMNKAVIYY